MPSKKCPTCGESFHVKPSHMNRRKTCSKKCSKKQIEKTCLHCGKPFTVQEYRKDTAKFCSKSCGSKYNWEHNIFHAHPFTDEHRKKISEAHKNRGTVPPSVKGMHWTLSVETRKRFSDAAKRGGRTPPSRKNAHHTEETKEKLRKIRLSQKFHTKNTSIEVAMQNELNNRKIVYQTHLPVCGVCVPNIVFPEKKIAVFADGDYWHSKEFNDGKTWRRDRNQDKLLGERGWRVFRFWGYEIRENVKGCVDRLLAGWDR